MVIQGVSLIIFYINTNMEAYLKSGQFGESVAEKTGSYDPCGPFR